MFKIPVGDMEVSVLYLSHENNLMLCGSVSAVVRMCDRLFSQLSYTPVA
jgi:hypothetical protein